MQTEPPGVVAVNGDAPPLEFDLNAKRAARHAKQGLGPVIVLGYELDANGDDTDVAKRWQLPPSLPLSVINNAGALMQGNPLAIGRILRDLFGDEAVGVPEDPETGDHEIPGHPVFADLDFDDLMDLFAEVLGPAYGIDLGNSPASNRASRRTGARSRPTS